jgi:hypothetical protein
MSASTPQPPDSNMEVNEELDPAVEEEINHDATQADTMNIDGAADAEPAVNGITDAAQTFEARIPAKKDATLREFLGKMDEYAPIVSNVPLCAQASDDAHETCRFPTQSPTTTSHAPDCHRHPRPHRTSRASLRSLPRSSLRTLPPMLTNFPA